MKRRKEGGLPEHLREWPETNLEDLERFFRERMSEANGAMVLDVLARGLSP